MPSQPAAPATLPDSATATIPAMPVATDPPADPPADPPGVRRAIGRVITTLFVRVSAWLCELKPDELWLTLIVGATYTLSFEQLWQFALHQIGTPKELAWLFPLGVDGITIYAAYDAGRALRERKVVRVLWAWILTLGFTAVSMWFQYLGGQATGTTTGESWTLRLTRAFLPVALLVAIEIRNAARAARAAGAPTFWQLWKLRALQRAANGTPSWWQIVKFRRVVRKAWHRERMDRVTAGQLPGAAELAAVAADMTTMTTMTTHPIEVRRPPADQPATRRAAAGAELALAGSAPRHDTATTPRRASGRRRSARAATTPRRRAGGGVAAQPSHRVAARRGVVAELYTANRGITDTALTAKVSEKLGEQVSLRTVQRDLENLWRQERIPRRPRLVS